MVVNAFEAWWLRIVVMIVVFVGTAAVLAFTLRELLDPIAMQSIVYIVCLATMLFIEGARPFGSTMSTGLHLTKPSFGFAVYGVVLGSVFAIVIALSALALGGSFLAVNISISLFGVAVIVIFACGEEVVFRGTIFRALEERFGSTVAIVSTSIPFALVHMANPGSSIVSAVNVLLAGIALGTAVAVTGSLWMSMGFHVAWNLAIALGFGIVSGIDLPVDLMIMNDAGIPESFAWLVTGPFGVEDGLLTSVLLCLFTLAVIRLGKFDPFVSASRFRQHYRIIQDR